MQYTTKLEVTWRMWTAVNCREKRQNRRGSSEPKQNRFINL